jgi:hypothetical protein
MDKDTKLGLLWGLLYLAVGFLLMLLVKFTSATDIPWWQVFVIPLLALLFVALHSRNF